MATITFTDTTRTSTCLATGSGSASYTINRNTGAIETKLEVSKIEFTDQFGNLMRIISEPLISRNNGFWGIRIKVTVSVTDLYGGYFESSRSVPSGQSGGQFQNFSYTVPITWTYFSQALTAIKYDVTETSNQTSPLKTDYRQYETVLLRPSQNVTVQIGPNPLTDRITLNTEQNNQNNILINVEHRFRYYHLLSVQGNTNPVIVANLNGVTLNGVKVDVPYNEKKEINDKDGKSFRHIEGNSETTWNGADLVRTKLDIPSGSATAFTDLTLYLDRNARIFGRINAFDKPYPNKINVLIAGTGIEPTISLVDTGKITECKYLFEKFNILSDLRGSKKTFSRDTVPKTQISCKIDSSTLDTNLDDKFYTRLMFRGIHGIALNMKHAKEVSVNLGIVSVRPSGIKSNLRDYSPSIYGGFRNFNSYRYLEIDVKSKNSSNQSGVVSITCLPNDIKTYPIEATPQFTRFRIDLCSPTNKTSLVDVQDNPYPRLLPTDRTFTTVASQERTNSDYFGLTRISKIEIDNTNIEIKYSLQNFDFGVYLVENISTLSNFVGPFPDNLNKVFTDKIINNRTTLYFGKRHWQVDVDGRNEEEWDWGYENTGNISVEIQRTIKQFSDSLITNHTGWTVQRLIAATSFGRESYLNSDTGKMVWLGGGGLTFVKPGKYSFGKDYDDPNTDIQVWIRKNQSASGSHNNVIAQTLFDSINGDFIPDYNDPFETYTPNDGSVKRWMNLGAGVILRGQAHGLVLDPSNNKIKEDSEVALRYVENNTTNNRGTTLSDIQGKFYTGSPFGFGLKTHEIQNNSFVTNFLVYSSKQQRFVFKVRDLAKKQISAVENKLTNQILVAYNKTNDNVSLLSLDTIDNPFTYYTDLIYLNDSSSKFVGQNPVIVSSNTKNNYFNNSNSFVLAEKSNNIIISANFHSDDLKNWYPYTSKLGKQDSFILPISKLNSFCISNNSPELYNSFIDNGVLKLRVVNINLANITNAPNPFVYTIEIESSDDFSPVISLPSGDLLILFKIKSDSRKIFGRIFNNGFISQRFLIVDSSVFSNSPADIFSPSAVFDEKLNVVKIVFYHKTSLIYTECNLINLLSKSSSNPNRYHHIVGNEKESDYKTNIVSYYSTENISLPAQKSGIISSSRANKTDEVIVFYQDNNNLINSIVINPYKNTSKIKIYNVN
jgi:hypothetical protein